MGFLEQFSATKIRMEMPRGSPKAASAEFLTPWVANNSNKISSNNRRQSATIRVNKHSLRQLQRRILGTCWGKYSTERRKISRLPLRRHKNSSTHFRSLLFSVPLCLRGRFCC